MPSGKNILHIAAQFKNNYPFKLVIDFPKLNEKDYDGNYPIHVAAKEGNLSFLKNLVRVGFNVNQINEYGNTALSWAVLNKDKKMIAYLISKGAAVDTFIGGIYLKMTALMWLARNNEFELAKFLISKGANINAKNKNGDSVLDYALFGEDLTPACFLNSIGATSTKISPLQIKKLADGLCLYEKNILFKKIKDPEKAKDLHKV